MNDNLNIHQPIGNTIVQNVRTAVMGEFQNKRYENVHNPDERSGRDGNKL